MEGLKRKLSNKLAPTVKDYQPEWEVGDLLCQWWRPNFEKAMVNFRPIQNHFRFILRFYKSIPTSQGTSPNQKNVKQYF